MDHTAEHLDPAAPASAPASVAEVNAWLASLAAEGGGVGGRGGGGAVASELSLGPDPTPRGVSYLRALAAVSCGRGVPGRGGAPAGGAGAGRPREGRAPSARCLGRARRRSCREPPGHPRHRDEQVTRG